MPKRDALYSYNFDLGKEIKATRLSSITIYDEEDANDKLGAFDMKDM